MKNLKIVCEKLEGKEITLGARIGCLLLLIPLNIFEIPGALLLNYRDYLTEGNIQKPRVFECLHSIKMYFETARSGRFPTNEEYLERNNLKWMLKK